MFLRAGAVSLLLLLASRVLGLVRESAQAAALGSSGLADAVVLMLTLPDWLAGVLISGALAYVLLPDWARRRPQDIARAQRRLTWALGLLGLGLAALLWFGRDVVLRGLAPALLETGALGLASGHAALAWSLLALVPALWAALWATRLQHERDFTGLYGANLVVNGSVVVGLFVVAFGPVGRALWVLGVALLGASALRLVWLQWRIRRCGRTAAAEPAATSAAPAPVGPSVWVWALLIAGLPLVLPVAARSLAAQSGEGQLAVFNYAWKLVELPLLLAIQLVATIAFPSVTRAVAQSDAKALDAALAQAFALAWALACAAALGLLLAAPAVADLLFGWGRMPTSALVQVGEWGRIGALGLLPQALIAVGLTVLAARARLRAVVLGYGLGVIGLLTWGQGQGGAALMQGLNFLLLGVAGITVLGLVRLRAEGRAAQPHSGALAQAPTAPRLGVGGWLPLRLMALGVPMLAAAWWLASWAHSMSLALQWAMGGFAAVVSLGLGYAISPALRQALRR